MPGNELDAWSFEISHGLHGSDDKSLVENVLKENLTFMVIDSLNFEITSNPLIIGTSNNITMNAILNR